MTGLPRPVAPKRPQAMRPPPQQTGARKSTYMTRSSTSGQSAKTSGPAARTPGHSRNSSSGSASARNMSQNVESNIHVVVRVRGRNDREIRENSQLAISTNGISDNQIELKMGTTASANKTYQFDKVFAPAADQAMIFDEVVKPILAEVISGFNCTIFAYGQTGTGKTYTMSGDMTDTMGILSDAAGIIPRTLYSLFQKLEMEDAEWSVKCSFIELYNEELRDLLAVDDSTKLKIYEDNKKGHTSTMVQGVEETHINSANAGIKLLQKGSHKRQVAATKCNDLSSRSHTVFTITTHMKKTTETGEEFICAGKLNLVDLAGSENIQRSGAENKRAAEAGLINKSLLTLGRVINALVDKNSHIPYRESKLTRLLQDSLGGQTKTCLIATLSPAKSNIEETISTLDYAFRAKNIRNKPQVNSMIEKKKLLKEFTSEIEKLKSELIATRQRNGVYLTQEQYDELTKENESRRISIEEQKAKIEIMEHSLTKKNQDLVTITGNFNTLKKDHEATRITLQETEDTLEKTGNKLQATERALQEETALRIAHQQTEAELQTVGKELLTTVDRSMHDIECLHKVLRRKGDFHSKNQKIWNDSTATTLDLSNVIDTELESFKTQHSEQLASLENRVTTILSSEIEHVHSTQDQIKTSLEQFDKTREEVSDQAVQSRDEMNEVLEEIKVLREEVKTKVGEGLNGLSSAAERISGEVISELEQFHTQLHKSYSNLGREFKYIFDTLIQHTNAQRSEADYLRKQLQEANQKIMQANHAMAAGLQSTLIHEQRQSREEREKLIATISDLVYTSYAAQEARWVDHINEATRKINDFTETYDRADRQYTVRMDDWTKKQGMVADNIMTSRDTMRSNLQEDWTSVAEHNLSIQNSTKAVHQETIRIVDAQLSEMSTQMAALDQFVSRARSQNGQYHEARSQGLQRLAKDAHNSSISLCKEMAATSDNLAAAAATARQDVSALSSSLAAFTSAAHSPLSALVRNVEATKMLEYDPSGITPKKREWEYPTTLPQTKRPKVEGALLRPNFPAGGQSPSPTKVGLLSEVNLNVGGGGAAPKR